MLIVAVNSAAPGAHDAAVAAIRDRTLLWSLESEKDSYPRQSSLEAAPILQLAARLEQPADVVALGGGGKHSQLGFHTIGAGYTGVEEGRLVRAQFFGREARMFTSSHERSHIMMAVGMAPRNDADQHAVIVWEGGLGCVYLLNRKWKVVKHHYVLTEPGNRYAFLFALAHPAFPDAGIPPHHEYAGKLMALAAYGDPDNADAETVDRIIGARTLYPGDRDAAAKRDFRDSPIYNAGVEAQVTKDAAALLSNRIFEKFAAAAERYLPPGIPLYISGGCGLNCDWNVQWRELGYFSSVFVPPCTNDSGAALGTAIDALYMATGDPHIEWSVYSGLEFEWDSEPDPTRWAKRPLDEHALADALATGRVAAWVQGRWEMGPRALGNRSLLAEPFQAATRDRLNAIKRREAYRPIAPCCRLEDVGTFFDDASHDPHMLYFRRAVSDRLGAVTHVDGSARVQTVTAESNAPLYRMLSAFADRTGAGMLCNTSLNFKGFGFINRMSDLAKYCEAQGVSDMVVGDTWFTTSTHAAAQADFPESVPTAAGSGAVAGAKV